MDIVQQVIDTFLHLDKKLAIVVSQYGTTAYALLFLIIFMETGFVITPFLPGDSLLFAAGAIAVTSSLNIYVIYFLTLFAAIIGDTVNYWVGHYIGPKIFERESRFIKKEHLIRTQHFYDKYGGQAIVLARFVPIIRTFAPFVAGIARMSYTHFISYNIIGGVIWVSLFVWGGYFFGNLPFVKENFHYVVVAIILLSISPIIFEWLKARRNSKKESNKEIKPSNIKIR